MEKKPCHICRYPVPPAAPEPGLSDEAMMFEGLHELGYCSADCGKTGAIVDAISALTLAIYNRG